MTPNFANIKTFVAKKKGYVTFCAAWMPPKRLLEENLSLSLSLSVEFSFKLAGACS